MTFTLIHLIFIRFQKTTKLQWSTDVIQVTHPQWFTWLATQCLICISSSMRCRQHDVPPAVRYLRWTTFSENWKTMQNCDIAILINGKCITRLWLERNIFVEEMLKWKTMPEAVTHVTFQDYSEVQKRNQKYVNHVYTGSKHVKE